MVFFIALLFFRYYCLSAAFAVVKYVEYIQNILFAQQSLMITFEAIDESCLIGNTVTLFF